MKKLFVSLLFAGIISFQGSSAGMYIAQCDVDQFISPFHVESLAEYVSGTVIEKGQSIENGEVINSSVVWIPTYYGYHTFLSVLDSYILNHTSITMLTTWRLDDRNFYIIYLSEKDILIKIIYDSENSLLFLSLPVGY